MAALKPLYINHKRWTFISERLAQKDRPLHIVGIGRFGGNLALIKWLAQRGNSVIIWERQSQAEFNDALETVQNTSQGLIINWGSEPQLPRQDLIFLTPAVPPNADFLKHIDPKWICTEIELSMCLMSQLDTEVHVITGSVGKSTCCSLLAKLIETEVYGNIGRSLLGESQPWPKKVILELSSFQLHYLKHLDWKPSSLALTPLGEHHKKWHGGLKHYLESKERAFDLNANNRPRSRFDEKLSPLPQDLKLKLPGEHNHHNARLIFHHGLKVRPKHKLNLGDMARFRGLPHRLETVHQSSDLNCINDSKATSPDAVTKALLSFDGPVTLIIMGVYTSDWEVPLKLIIAKETQLHIVGSLSKSLGHLAGPTPTVHADLSKCIKTLPKGLKGTLLLSPGGPSYDQYSNYEERGRHFSDLCLSHFSKN